MASTSLCYGTWDGGNVCLVVDRVGYSEGIGIGVWERFGWGGQRG